MSKDSANALLLELLIEIGNVTIPGSEPMPSVDSLIEVEYLYTFHGGSLFQPVYKGLRPDKHDPDLYTSLKFKQESAEGD